MIDFVFGFQNRIDLVDGLDLTENIKAKTSLSIC